MLDYLSMCIDVCSCDTNLKQVEDITRREINKMLRTDIDSYELMAANGGNF